MIDKRIYNGGARKGSGRKSKEDEQLLIEKLSPMDELALNKLEQAIKEDKPWAIKLYFEYRYGKPKEKKDTTIHTEQPLFN